MDSTFFTEVGLFIFNQQKMKSTYVRLTASDQNKRLTHSMGLID